MLGARGKRGGVHQTVRVVMVRGNVPLGVDELDGVAASGERRIDRARPVVAAVGYEGILAVGVRKVPGHDRPAPWAVTGSRGVAGVDKPQRAGRALATVVVVVGEPHRPAGDRLE